MTKNLMTPSQFGHPANVPTAPEMQARDVTLAAEQQRAKTEVEASYLVAMNRPRNEDRSMRALERAIGRLSFAEDAYYSFPRGKKEVSGPSINFAREFARVWGNMKYGFRVVYDDEEKRTIEAYAVDLEWNTMATREASFKKLIQRKDPETGVTRWIVPDERDLRELTSRHASVEMRNCILQLCPKDITDEMINQARQSVKAALKGADIKDVRERAKTAFSEMGIYAEQLETYLGHSIDEATADEIAEVRGILKAIKDGVATREEYFGRSGSRSKIQTPPQEGGLSLDQVLKPPQAQAEEAPTTPAPPSTPPPPESTIPDFLPPVSLGDGSTEKGKKKTDSALLEKIKCPTTHAMVRKSDCINLCRVKKDCPAWTGKLG